MRLLGIPCLEKWGRIEHNIGKTFLTNAYVSQVWCVKDHNERIYQVSSNSEMVGSRISGLRACFFPPTKTVTRSWNSASIWGQSQIFINKQSHQKKNFHWKPLPPKWWAECRFPQRKACSANISHSTFRAGGNSVKCSSHSSVASAMNMPANDLI